MVYKCFNITRVEGIIHCGSKVIVEVLDECIIIFKSDTFHVGVKFYFRTSGTYLPRLRLFTYTVDQSCVSIKDVSKMLEKNKCKVIKSKYLL